MLSPALISARRREAWKAVVNPLLQRFFCLFFYMFFGCLLVGERRLFLMITTASSPFFCARSSFPLSAFIPNAISLLSALTAFFPSPFFFSLFLCDGTMPLFVMFSELARPKERQFSPPVSPFSFRLPLQEHPFSPWRRLSFPFLVLLQGKRKVEVFFFFYPRSLKRLFMFWYSPESSSRYASRLPLFLPRKGMSWISPSPYFGSFFFSF